MSVRNPAGKMSKIEQGQGPVLAALVLTVLLSLGALAVDVSTAHMAKTRMQNAADAAALAGAKGLPNVGVAETVAASFAQLNGAGESCTKVTTPYNGDPSKIEVVCTRNVQYSLSKVLGFTDSDVSARAVAEKVGMDGGPFDYAVFSGDPGSTLGFTGMGTTINGDIHSNYNMKFTGSGTLVKGSAEAVGAFEMVGSDMTVLGDCRGQTICVAGSSQDVGGKVYQSASWVDMPDFSEMIKTQAELLGQAYSGNVTFIDDSVNMDFPIYIDGNLTVNGCSFEGIGTILVTGDITFDGSAVTGQGEAVCFYSKNGSIEINGYSTQVDGVIYAPAGTVTMNGSHQIVNGRVIGNRVEFHGNWYSITARADDLSCLPQSGTKLVE